VHACEDVVHDAISLSDEEIDSAETILQQTLLQHCSGRSFTCIARAIWQIEGGLAPQRARESASLI